MPERPKVIFVAGWGRSGTTLLDKLLGQMDGWFSAGELGSVWDRGVLENSTCACSRPFRSCPVWSRAATDYVRKPAEEIRRIVELRDAFKNRYCWCHLTESGRRYVRKKTSELRGHVSELYARLVDVTGARVIVDSSKRPAHGYLLQMIDAIDLHVVHIVRDPRGVAFSWRKRGKVYDENDGQRRHFHRIPVLLSTLIWIWWNVTVEYLWGRSGRYCRVRYEDLVSEPKKVLKQIAESVGEEVRLDYFDDECTATLEPTHLVAGNPSRFQNGKTHLRLDEQWRSALPLGGKLLATASSFPLLVRYGYGLRR